MPREEVLKPMEFKDYYATLGVAPTATADEIKRAYRKLARKFHPDVSKEKDATERFKVLGEAYEVLKDAEKRATYDDYKAQRARGPRPGRRTGAGPGQRNGDFSEADVGDFGDLFARMFGGEARDDFGEPSGAPFGGRTRNARGEDVRASLALTLEEAYAGTTQTIEVRTSPSPLSATAPSSRTLRVKVPAGVVEGQEIRLKNQGGPGQGGAPAGHLYVQIKIAAHPHFALDGKSILLRVPLLPWEAALGARVRVPTLAGAVDVNVPAGQSEGSRLRLKGRGMPAFQQGGANLPSAAVGDQYLVFQIVVPPPADDAERELYKRLADLPHANPRGALEAP